MQPSSAAAVADRGLSRPANASRKDWTAFCFSDTFSVDPFKEPHMTKAINSEALVEN